MGRYRNRLILAFLLLLIIIAVARIAVMVPERADKDDFAHYYISARVYLSGENPYYIDLSPLYGKYGFTMELKQELITRYPPAFLAVLAPFAMLGPSKAFLCWLIFQIICMVYILVQLKILMSDRLSEALSLTGFVLLIFLATGFDYWITYIVRSFTSFSGESYAMYYNYSLPSFIVNLSYALHGSIPAGPKGVAINFSGTIVGLLMLTVGYLYCFKNTGSAKHEFGFLIILMLLTFPHILGHYYVFLIFPLSLIFIANNSAYSVSRTKFLWMLVAYIVLNLHHLPFLVTPYLASKPDIFLMIFLNYVPFFGLFGLFLYFGVILKRISPKGLDQSDLKESMR